MTDAFTQPDWGLVAAPGTDPDRLAWVIATAGDPTQTAEQVFADWCHEGVRVALHGDPAYPVRLAVHDDAPPLLAVRGAWPPDVATVAIVGSRAATSYGRGIAAWLAEAAALAGVHVVSGGARGVDAAAHEAAVGVAGTTTVVLGCGHRVAYPRPHAAPGGLFTRIVEAGGGLVSEFLPGAPPRAHRVRARNRIVSALADVVVVVEGGARSGTLLTATRAAEQGVTVLAVPGDVRAPGSAAPHRLLAEGAGVCAGPQDLLDVVALSGRARAVVESGDGAPHDGSPSVLTPDVRRVLADAWPRAVTVESLARDSGLTAGALLAALTRARLAGEVAQDTEGIRLRRAPPNPH